jgi:hypothetical protein
MYISICPCGWLDTTSDLWDAVCGGRIVRAGAQVDVRRSVAGTSITPAASRKQVDVVRDATVVEQPVELLVIDPVRPLDLAIRRCRCRESCSSCRAKQVGRFSTRLGGNADVRASLATGPSCASSRFAARGTRRRAPQNASREDRQAGGGSCKTLISASSTPRRASRCASVAQRSTTQACTPSRLQIPYLDALRRLLQDRRPMFLTLI